MDHKLKAAVFLDRDGTLNREKGYLHRWEDFEWLPGVKAGLERLARAGFLLVVVTNQSGVGRGFYSLEDVALLHKKVAMDAQASGFEISAFHFCPHLPDAGCVCRKPLPGMIFQAARELGISLENSWMVGDKAADVEAGLAAGCRSILVLSGYGKSEIAKVPDETLIADTFGKACELILAGREK